MKICSKCQQNLPLSEFYSDRGKPRSECKDCVRQARAIYRQEHPGKIRAANRKHYETNRDQAATYARQRRAEHGETINARRRELADPQKRRAQNRASYQRHAEKRKAERRQYYAAHAEQVKELVRKWRSKNPEANRMRHKRRRDRKLQSGIHYTSVEWKALCDHFGNTCICCGQQEELTADHVIPLDQGGSDAIENIQPLCKPCNSKKHTKTTDYRNEHQMSMFLIMLREANE